MAQVPVDTTVRPGGLHAGGVRLGHERRDSARGGEAEIGRHRAQAPAAPDAGCHVGRRATVALWPSLVLGVRSVCAIRHRRGPDTGDA